MRGPRASDIALCRWFYGSDRQPWFVVVWEDDEKGDEHEVKYRTLTGALNFVARMADYSWGAGEEGGEA